MGVFIVFVFDGLSDGLLSLLFGPDSYRVFDWGDEDFAVTDFPGLGGLNDGGDGVVDMSVVDHNFEFQFWQEVHGVFASAVDFRMPFLPAKAFDFGHGHSGKANIPKRFFDFIQLERLYDGFYFFH
jgi:hypothetical protein